MANRLRRALVLLLAVLGVVFIADPFGDDASLTVTVRTNTAPGDGHPTTTVTAPAEVVEELADKVTPLHDETPPGMSAGEARSVKRAAARNRRLTEPLPTAGASAGFEGCVTRFVRNQSSRGGVRPQWQVLHYTVSRNVPGWDDVNAIVALFDRPSAQASSNFVIDAEGHCAYIVPIEAKAWTQAAANPFSISYEVINSGTEATFMGTAGYAKLRSVMTQVERRTGIPRTRGSTNGCVPGRRGTVQHADFGVCGGGHHDIGPFSIAAVLRIVGGPAPKPVTAHARTLCQELNRARRAKRFGARSTAVKRALVKKGYSCRFGPPGRVTRS